MKKQDRILKALNAQSVLYAEINAKLREEERAGNITYDKCAFYYRKSKCSTTYAIDYIKQFYPEIKISKKKLKELIRESNIINHAGYGSIGYTSSYSFSGVGRCSYDLLEMDSVDQFAVSLIGGLE